MAINTETYQDASQLGLDIRPNKKGNLSIGPIPPHSLIIILEGTYSIEHTNHNTTSKPLPAPFLIPGYVNAIAHPRVQHRLKARFTIHKSSPARHINKSNTPNVY